MRDEDFDGLEDKRLRALGVDTSGDVLDVAVRLQQKIEEHAIDEGIDREWDAAACKRKAMTYDELQEVLRLHRLWDESHHKDGHRADLSELQLPSFHCFHALLPFARFNNVGFSSSSSLAGCDLTRAAFHGADLRRVILKNANLLAVDIVNTNLTFADFSRAECHKARIGTSLLRHANLRDSIFHKADLTSSDLTRANLHSAQLVGAILAHTNFSCATICHANLRDALLHHADLTHADLEAADLTGADLTGACLCYANLRRADLTNATLTNAIFTKARMEGALLPPDFVLASAEARKTAWEMNPHKEAHDVLVNILTNGTRAAQKRIRARLRFFRDIAAMPRPNLYAFAKAHGIETTTAGHYRDDLQDRLGGIKLTQPSTREGARWNEIELSPVGRALVDWIALHPEHLTD